jgi:hypothetical protein
MRFPSRGSARGRTPVRVLPLFLLLLSLSGLSPARAVEPTLRWADHHDGGANATDYGTAALVLHPSGDLVVGSEARDGFAGSDMLIRRLDRASSGEVWQATWGVAEGNDMALTGLVDDGHGRILVGGYIRGCPT